MRTTDLTTPPPSGPTPLPGSSGGNPFFGLERGVYDRVRSLAARVFRKWVNVHSWQVSDLTHEALLRLRARLPQLGAADPAVFDAAVTTAMTRALIDHHRTRTCARQGGPNRPGSLDGIDVAAPASPAPNELGAQLEGYRNRRPVHFLIAWLHGVEACPLREVADTLGLRYEAAQAKWKLARAELRELLDRP
jgi:DNA-directed RNA polymerase specialized sigma24 family protein